MMKKDKISLLARKRMAHPHSRNCLYKQGPEDKRDYGKSFIVMRPGSGTMGGSEEKLLLPIFFVSIDILDIILEYNSYSKCTEFKTIHINMLTNLSCYHV